MASVHASIVVLSRATRDEGFRGNNSHFAEEPKNNYYQNKARERNKERGRREGGRERRGSGGGAKPKMKRYEIK